MLVNGFLNGSSPWSADPCRATGAPGTEPPAASQRASRLLCPTSTQIGRLSVWHGVELLNKRLDDKQSPIPEGDILREELLLATLLACVSMVAEVAGNRGRRARTQDKHVQKRGLGLVGKSWRSKKGACEWSRKRVPGLRCRSRWGETAHVKGLEVTAMIGRDSIF